MLTAQYMGFLFILKILSVESALYELRGRFFIESRIQCLLFLEGSRSSEYGLPVIGGCNYRAVITAVITGSYSPPFPVTCNL